jgi:glycosyltransferase involved in cell wall biosynthesis
VVYLNIALYNLTTTIKKGGIETFCWGLAKNLSNRNIKIYLYGGKTNDILTDKENLEIITLSYLPRNKFPDFGSRFRKFMERLSFAYYALPELKKNKYDFFCIFKPYDFPVALYLKKLTNCKIIFFSGGTEFFPGYRKMVKKIDFLFSCSEFNANQIEEYTNVRPIVLPNGIDTDIFKPLMPDIKLKSELNIKEDETVIITVCRLVGWKGVQYSIRAVDKLIRAGYLIKYLVIGDGEERKNLEKIVFESNLNDKFIFLGNINNSLLPKYYSIADIAVFPSIANETFGISIAEAMSCGVPVISTTVGGIPEVVGDAGILVSPKDENAIADMIKFLIENSYVRKELGIKGRNRVIENFSWDRVIYRFLENISA